MTKLLIACLICIASQALASSDDRFIKKYAMMKIYESCFGPEVVKQIRKEMKAAYAKCSEPPPPPTPSFDDASNSLPSILLGKLPPGFAMDPSMQTITKPTDGAVHGQDDLRKDGSQQQHYPGPQKFPNMMGFRPQGPFPQQAPPTQAQPQIPPYMMPGQFRPYNPAFFQLPYNAQLPFYPPQYNPYAFQQYQQYYQNPYFTGSNRISKQMDFRDQLYPAISRNSQVRNITCVMQELGYIDHNLEPNYEAITQRISNLPVSSELKGDIQDGLQFCQKFSQCVPDIKKDVAPISQELIKPMFFFRCYKHKKLEACIMKDIRERFTSEDELETDGDFGFHRSLSRSARSAREEPFPDTRFQALDEMAVYLYDFLSGGNSFNFDLYM